MVPFALPAMAGTDAIFADSSRVYDLDEVVVVSQAKESYGLRISTVKQFCVYTE